MTQKHDYKAALEDFEAILEPGLNLDWQDVDGILGPHRETIRHALETMANTGWQPIDTCPDDIPVLLANFKAADMMTGIPHVWSGRKAKTWVDMDGNITEEDDPEILEYSHAATNENGEATHWAPMIYLPEIADNGQKEE